MVDSKRSGEETALAFAVIRSYIIGWPKQSEGEAAEDIADMT